jgi:hypothetical protein
LLPDKLPSTAETNFLVAENDAWLDIADSKYPMPLRAQLSYWKAKSRLIAAQLEGQESAVRPEVLSEWELLWGASSLGIDYYFDVANYATQQAEQSVGAELQHWGRLAGRAFEHVLYLADREGRAIADMMYSKLLQRLYAALLREAFLETLRLFWQTSVSLGRPNAQTGTWLAELLLERRNAEEAQAVLKKILANVCWGDALLALSRQASSDSSLEQYVLTYVREHEVPAEWGTPLNAAIACYAVSLILKRGKDRTAEEEWLRRACEYYELAAMANLGATWPVHGEEKWQPCVDRLQALGAEGWKDLRRKWRQAREEWEAQQKARRL